MASPTATAPSPAFPTKVIATAFSAASKSPITKPAAGGAGTVHGVHALALDTLHRPSTTDEIEALMPTAPGILSAAGDPSPAFAPYSARELAPSGRASAHSPAAAGAGRALATPYSDTERNSSAAAHPTAVIRTWAVVSGVTSSETHPKGPSPEEIAKKNAQSTARAADFRRWLEKTQKEFGSLTKVPLHLDPLFTGFTRRG